MLCKFNSHSYNRKRMTSPLILHLFIIFIKRKFFFFLRFMIKAKTVRVYIVHSIWSTYFDISVRPLMKYVFTYSVPTFTFAVYDFTSCVLAKFIVTLCIFNVGKICEKINCRYLENMKNKKREKFWLRKVFLFYSAQPKGSKSLDCWNISPHVWCWSSWPFRWILCVTYEWTKKKKCENL